MFVLIYYYIYLLLYYIILYIIIYLYLYIIIFIYIIIIYIVMCPKNGTIFIFRVPGMGLFIFGFCFLYFNDRGFYINAGSGILGWMTLV